MRELRSCPPACHSRAWAVSPLAYLCPGCGALVGKRGRCAACKRTQERERYNAEPIRRLRGDRRWKRARAIAKRRDGNRCTTCGATASLEVHHVVALEDGGGGRDVCLPDWGQHGCDTRGQDYLSHV